MKIWINEKGEEERIDWACVECEWAGSELEVDRTTIDELGPIAFFRGKMICPQCKKEDTLYEVD